MASFRDRARRALGGDWDRSGRDRDAAYAADQRDWDDFEDDLAAPVADDDRTDDDLADEDDAADAGPAPARRAAAAGRRAPRRTVLRALRDIPDYLRLAWGLLRDGRVSKADKLLVAAAALYVLNPFDFIPDVIPFLGEIDDLFLLVLAMQRLIARAGRAVLLDHWPGRPEALDSLDLAATLSAAAFFLPRRMRRRLRGVLGSRERD
ncbi:MAG: DUF1232 domain-containing protein [Gemmatimonadaceae bacterium]|jgi:uncharacterized membrane protein YkvA (DUF1232 family)|nr:DUF1232 domain-containing protein [Gemmatimonadaceae bacterium]